MCPIHGMLNWLEAQILPVGERRQQMPPASVMLTPCHLLDKFRA